MNNKFIKLPLVLAIFAFVCTLFIGITNVITKPIIDDANVVRNGAAYQVVFGEDLPGFETIEVTGNSVISQGASFSAGGKDVVAYIGTAKINASGAGDIVMLVGFESGTETIAGIGCISAAVTGPSYNPMTDEGKELIQVLVGKEVSSLTDPKIVRAGSTRTTEAILTIINAALEVSRG